MSGRTDRSGTVLILGGTSEGRQLAEYAEWKRIPALVTVVSEYGMSLLRHSIQKEPSATASADAKGSFVRVYRGRLDREAMEQLLRAESPEFVLDATHPYASRVTETAAKVCDSLEIPCFRVLRQSERLECADLYEVDSAKEAAAFLEKTEGRVFLTTGSKEIEVFVSSQALKERIVARILPDSRVLAACEALGLRGDRMIAMQGPFSEEMNAAMLRQSGARWLVTKESGDRGGFADKIRAAKDCGVGVVVIRRPLREEGISMEEAMRMMETLVSTDGRETEASGRKVCLIGIGMGGGAHLTREALEALAGCDALFGAPRMLEAVKEFAGHVPMEPLYQAGKILDWLTRHPACRNAVAACSGDTGFYSGGESLAVLLKQNGFEVKICPGISSAAALAARLGCGWEDWHLDSMHGRNSDPVKLLERYEKVFLLLGGEHGIRDVCRRLASGGWQSARVTAGIRLGYPQEQINSGTVEQYAHYTGDDGLSCMLIERTGMEFGVITGQEG